MLTGAVLNPLFFLQCHEICEKIVRNEERARKRPKMFCHFGSSITHPQNGVAFSAFFGFALPGASAGSDKNTVSGAALSLAVSGFLKFFEVVPLWPIFWGGGRGGLCVRWRSTRSRSRHSRANKKKKKMKKKKTNKKKIKK